MVVIPLRWQLPLNGESPRLVEGDRQQTKNAAHDWPGVIDFSPAFSLFV